MFCHILLSILKENNCDYYLDDGYNLGRFIYSQKILKKNGELSEDKVKLFDRLGIDWSIKEVKKNPSWDEMFILASNYYNKNEFFLFHLIYISLLKFHLNYL